VVDFKVGDKVKINGFFTEDSSSTLLRQYKDNWIVVFDKPYFFGDRLVRTQLFHKQRFELIDARERFLNLELDPYGEEIWYV